LLRLLHEHALPSLTQANLPGPLHAVNNEVADFNSVLLELSSLIDGWGCLPESELSAVPRILQQANKKLVGIKNLPYQGIRAL
jgi:hypothetical protein